MFSAEVLITPYSSETKSLLFCECTKITKACVHVHVFLRGALCQFGFLM